MSPFSKQEQLHHLLDEQQEQVSQSFPANKQNAIIALTYNNDCHLTSRDLTVTPLLPPLPNPPFYASGWQKALQLCYGPSSSSLSQIAPENSIDAWAKRVLSTCDSLAAGEQILEYCETGFMKMQQGGGQNFSAWITSKKMPTEWREREDIAWWSHMLSKTYTHEIQALASEKAALLSQIHTFTTQWQPNIPLYHTTPELDDYYLRLGTVWSKCMVPYFLYPPQTLIGDCTVELYRAVLAVLIGWSLKQLDISKAFVAQYPSYPLQALLTIPHNTARLIEALSQTLAVDLATISRVVEAYSLSSENVTYHCARAGTPTPPLLRLDDQHLIWSLTGLLTGPFFFLARELKRRYSHEYHSIAHLNEEIFRQDLYNLFSEDRFVKSSGSRKLRGIQGDLTTDIDALIFDRKTGALALFELKSQDPFAYSLQERTRQRNYFYNAGKQVLASVQWINHYGANALLSRLDSRQIKRLKVQKTYIFVLGRYLAHFFDGQEFDQRAAWGTWPQVLRWAEATGLEDAGSFQSLSNSLMKDTPLISSGPVTATHSLQIRGQTISVYPNFETFKQPDD